MWHEIFTATEDKGQKAWHLLEKFHKVLPKALMLENLGKAELDNFTAEVEVLMSAVLQHNDNINGKIDNIQIDEETYHNRFPAEVEVRDDVELSRKVSNIIWSEIPRSLGLGDPVIVTEVYLSASGFHTEGQAFQVKECTGHYITIEPIVKGDDDFVIKPDVVVNLESLLEVVTVRRELLQDEMCLESVECHEHSYGGSKVLMS
ncbi:PREDICTED: uncharacterized protein LOC109475404 [Branchiostoma belcheri]|uniref:Uncharacterized protein LOC109475404 n=1 Tax=Branchiostoma belcheri TaxID=7741 RepID=A0A6P4ZKF7_BRABE|nr:PREDICTED: uncharacterized protein LOC109475404 [Branchiostoma belcheri]